MADQSATQTVILGLVGGLIPLAFKYVVDRFSESHKAAVSVAAKRRDRFHEEQAKVIAGTYARLSRAVETLFSVFIAKLGVEKKPSWDTLGAEFTEQAKKTLSKADEAFDEFKDYFSENEIYFPRQLSERVNYVAKMILIFKEMVRIEIVWKNTKVLDAIQLDHVQELQNESYQLLVEMRDRFREMMLGNDQEHGGAWSKIWKRVKDYKDSLDSEERQQARRL